LFVASLYGKATPIKVQKDDRRKINSCLVLYRRNDSPIYQTLYFKFSIGSLNPYHHLPHQNQDFSEAKSIDALIKFCHDFSILSNNEV